MSAGAQIQDPVGVGDHLTRRVRPAVYEHASVAFVADGGPHGLIDRTGFTAVAAVRCEPDVQPAAVADHRPLGIVEVRDPSRPVRQRVHGPTDEDAL